ncbi:MAG: DUF3368 domain-containing protein [Acidobacteria bacterium]|nr:DUF3368 domain-containing protein [Acidobacteriota bacterium]
MIISNATPLIAFSRIGRLDLLRDVVAGELTVPEAVARELSEYRAGRPGTVDLTHEGWIRVRTVQDQQQVRLLLPTLDRGEAEVIALGLESNARLLLIDELIGRKVAESLGLKISGSVGILIRAKQIGALTAVRPPLEEMVRNGIFFSQRFLDAVFRQVEE